MSYLLILHLLIRFLAGAANMESMLSAFSLACKPSAVAGLQSTCICQSAFFWQFAGLHITWVAWEDSLWPTGQQCCRSPAAWWPLPPNQTWPGSSPPAHTKLHVIAHLFVRSFIHSCMHSFIHSFIHACIHSFIHSFIHLFIQSFNACLSPGSSKGGGELPVCHCP